VRVRGAYTAAFMAADRPPYKNVTVGELLSRLARALPDSEALVFAGGPRYTFASLDREARVIARGLIAAGVEAGERVVLWATNVPEWIVVQFAVAKIGAVLVPANVALRAADMQYVLSHSGASTILTICGFRGLDYLAALDELGARSGRLPALKRLIYIGADEAPAGFMPYRHLRDLANDVDDSAVDARSRAVALDDLVSLLYTSGTTASPKGVMLSSRNIVNNTCDFGHGLGYTPADRLCLCVPLFHSFGCIFGVLASYTHGVCVCPIESFDPTRVLETIQAERCTSLYGVPTMFLAELESPQFDRYDLSSLRTGAMAGAPCPPVLVRRVMVDMHLPEITIAYGLTEASAITQTCRDASLERRTNTVGMRLPDLEVKIVDPITRQDVPRGVRGELCVRGYSVTSGYYGDPDGTRAAIDSEGWLQTGDEAIRDDDESFRITGRIKDLIIRGGQNIGPAEIEECLSQHPAVDAVCAYGVPDAYFGEIVAVAVRPKPDSAAQATSEDLVSWCRERLPRFKVPAAIRFVADFPTTASGKVQRFKLREQHAGALQNHA
jgi:fatty-acyl-CoA synthase